MLRCSKGVGFTRAGAGMVRCAYAHRPALRGFRGLGAVVIALVAASGCFQNVPLMGAAPPGSQLVLTLNDRGRAAVGDSLGSGVAFIEGQLAAETDTTFALRVFGVGYLNRQFNEWGGEPYTVRKEHVATAIERRYSRERTWLAIGGAAVGLTAFALTRGFGVLGSSPIEGDGTVDPPLPDDQ